MNKGIQGIILDVDGVIVGEKIGVNSPYPHPSVLQRLSDLRQKNGIVISLCTAKPHFAIRKIIDDAHLDNLHITDGGGVIIDPIDNVVVTQHTIPKDVAKEVLETYLASGVYVEFYTPQGYYIQSDRVSKITEGHTHVLQHQPTLLANLAESSIEHEITKIMPIATDVADKARLTSLFQDFQDRLTLSWGVHPVMLPLQFGIITAPGISKQQGVFDIAKTTGIPLENFLGIGDSTSDWQFIQPCGYGASVSNASQELKNLVLSKGDSRSFIGPGVDEHGILKILDHFFD